MSFAATRRRPGDSHEKGEPSVASSRFLPRGVSLSAAIHTRRSSFYFEAVGIALQSILAHKLRSLPHADRDHHRRRLGGRRRRGDQRHELATWSSGWPRSWASTTSWWRAWPTRATSPRRSGSAWTAATSACGWDDFEAVAPPLRRRARRWARRSTASRTCGAAATRCLGTQIAGVTANMARIEDKTIEDGRFLLPHEVDHAAAGVRARDGRPRQALPGHGADRPDAARPGRRAARRRRRGPARVDVRRSRSTTTSTSRSRTYGRIFGRHQSIQIHGLGASREIFPEAIDEARVAMRVHHKLDGQRGGRLRPGERRRGEQGASTSSPARSPWSSPRSRSSRSSWAGSS